MLLNAVGVCDQDGEIMHRVPQPLRAWYRNANDTLFDWCEVNLKRWKKKVPRFSPDHVNNPDGIPGVDFDTRKRVKPNARVN
jgi:hypothetical protein